MSSIISHEIINVCLPKNVNVQNAEEIISILGEDKIKEVYSLTSCQPISFAALIKIIKFKEVEKELDNSEPLNKIARKTGVSKKTIYKIFKNKLLIRSLGRYHGKSID
jgi:DNA-binding XRE family transcriptional regulator